MMRPATLILSVLALAADAAASERTLFDFRAPDAARRWQAVNDNVMGGRSQGRFRMTDDRTMLFTGNLSLANNGGFASVRSRAENLNLSTGDTIVARVRGDGREYSFNLYPSRQRTAFSYRTSFRTKKDEWIEVRLPLTQFVATSFGRVVRNQPLDPAKVSGVGILLGDKKPGAFRLEVDWIKVRPAAPEPINVMCEGTYRHHLQGVCSDERAIYWSFTTTLVQTDMQGKVTKQVPVANHHGDLCQHAGRLFVAVNLGEFNNPAGKADSWVYVYDAKNLKEVARHRTPEVTYGAGGIGFRDGKFYVVGGLPDDVDENYVYEYDSKFEFLKKHTIASGHTHLGIQTAAFAHDRWWFGCYGSPAELLVTDKNFRMLGRFKRDCSLGIDGLSDGRLLVGSGKCNQSTGCVGSVQTALPDKKAGFTNEQGEER